ncbi:MAG: hypothetical protein Q4D38_05755 [Planctomycetia bacterium]|nr:hypothetical protein [Planctomycetia bacterium]
MVSGSAIYGEEIRFYGKDSVVTFTGNHIRSGSETPYTTTNNDIYANYGVTMREEDYFFGGGIAGGLLTIGAEGRTVRQT